MGRTSLLVGVLAGLIPLAAAQGQVQIAMNERVEAVMIASDRGTALPLQEERLRVTIDGQHASTTLLQVHRNTGGQIEGRYRLRAGAGARVEGFAYWNGEQKIVGEVFEKQMAREVYDSVTNQRRDPGLLEAEGEGVFGFKVFPIQPNEDKRIEIRYTKWLERRGGTVVYRAPVTRADAEILVTIEGVAARNVSSPTHKLFVDAARGGGVRVRAEGAAGAGGQFVLTWQVSEAAWTPAAFVHRDGEHDGYFAVSLAAPDAAGRAAVAKDVTLVLDRSGSMSGTPLVHAKAAAADMIRRLEERDRVNVIAFSDEVDPLFESPKGANAETKKRALAFVERMTDGGGTDLALALKTALASQDASERPRVLIFMTDGQSDGVAAFAAAQADKHDVRVFTVGLGDGVNRPLLARLAAMKRGRFTFIAEAEDIERDAARLYAQIARPLLVNVSVEITGAMAVRTYPRSMPDVFVDDQLLVTGRLRGDGKGKVTIRGELDGRPMAYVTEIDARPKSRPWVAKLWAQSRVDDLLEQIALEGEKRELEDEVIELALAYNFVTPYTAFLAIPDSELQGAARDRVVSARDRKKKIMAKNADAAAVDGTGAGPVGKSMAASAAPPSPPRPPSPSIDPAGADSSAEEEAVDEGTMRGETMRVQKRGGCAGCVAARDEVGGGAWLAGAVLVALLMALRRRRFGRVR